MARKPLKIRIGGRYLLRNGAIARITGLRQIHTKIDGKPALYPLWVGHFEGGEEQRCSWQIEGTYSPIAGNTNGLDIVAKASARKRGKHGSAKAATAAGIRRSRAGMGKRRAGRPSGKDRARP